MKYASGRGFSLVELAVTIGIISVLVGVALAMYVDHIAESKITRARADIKVILEAVIRYRHEYAFDPFYELSDLTGRYLARVPTDPWGLKYRIDALDGVIASAGPDGVFDTPDDIAEIYPNPRLKVGLLPGTDAVNGIVQLKIEGRLTAPRATLVHAGGTAFPVALVSHYRDTLDFNLNYVEPNVKPLRFPGFEETLYPVDSYRVTGLESVFDRPYDTQGFLREDAFGRFSMNILLVAQKDARRFCEHMQVLRRMNVPYLLPDGGTALINARSTLPEAFYYREGFGPWGIGVLCMDRRDGGAVAEIERFEYWGFRSISVWIEQALGDYLESGLRPRPDSRFYYSTPRTRVAAGDLEQVSGNWISREETIRVW